MKIIKVLEKTELVIVDLEVNLGKEKRNGLTLCVKYNGAVSYTHLRAHET